MRFPPFASTWIPLVFWTPDEMTDSGKEVLAGRRERSLSLARGRSRSSGERSDSSLTGVGPWGGQFQAADLTGVRGWVSSKWMGSDSREPSAGASRCSCR